VKAIFLDTQFSMITIDETGEITMTNLEDTVHSVVQDFIDNGMLFTALDVSNKVKETIPNARHREVRDEVRAMFADSIETQDYCRTPITVNLEDSSTATAMLYHPSDCAWELDDLYDQQQRAQTSFHPVAAAQAAVSALQNTATQATATPMPGSATITVSASVPMPTARTLWEQMFATQPSLFPTK
jgi:hypothetical protein